MFRGKEQIRPATERGSSSTFTTDKDSSALAWSRGLGVELSPLQTRSSRKKKEIEISQIASTDLPTQEGKALRALKALARTKK
jgi:hypothetical protein